MRILHKIIKEIQRLDKWAEDNFPDAGLGGLLVLAVSAGAILYGLIIFIYFGIVE